MFLSRPGSLHPPTKTKGAGRTVHSPLGPATILAIDSSRESTYPTTPSLSRWVAEPMFWHHQVMVLKHEVMFPGTHEAMFSQNQDMVLHKIMFPKLNVMFSQRQVMVFHKNYVPETQCYVLSAWSHGLKHEVMLPWAWSYVRTESSHSILNKIMFPNTQCYVLSVSSHGLKHEVTCCYEREVMVSQHQVMVLT
jgi:hypothetical protein